MANPTLTDNFIKALRPPLASGSRFLTKRLVGSSYGSPARVARPGSCATGPTTGASPASRSEPIQHLNSPTPGTKPSSCSPKLRQATTQLRSDAAPVRPSKQPPCGLSGNFSPPISTLAEKDIGSPARSRSARGPSEMKKVSIGATSKRSLARHSSRIFSAPPSKRYCAT